MAITASELRAQIYKLLDEVLESGKPLEIERKGKLLRIVPAEPAAKLAKLVRRDEAVTGDPGDLVHLDWSSEWRP